MIKGVKLKRSCLVLSHLFFADDSLFLAEAKADVAGGLRKY